MKKGSRVTLLIPNVWNTHYEQIHKWTKTTNFKENFWVWFGYLSKARQFMKMGIFGNILKMMGWFCKIGTGAKVMQLAEKVPISKKSTIPAQNDWNFCIWTNSWVDQIGQLSLDLDDNCRFFINNNFLSQSHYFCTSL